jgi:hypothetical protein
MLGPVEIMRGAILFFLTLLAVVPSARAPIVAFWDETMTRIAADYPTSYVILMTGAVLWLISALMVTVYRRVKRHRQQVMVYFQGAVAPGANRHV